MIFYPRVLQYFRVSKTIPVLACLVALMIWHSCYRAWSFEVCGPKLYQSENKFLHGSLEFMVNNHQTLRAGKA